MSFALYRPQARTNIALLLSRAVPVNLVAVVFVLVTSPVTAQDAAPPSRIGHYSTANGLVGFVLYRLGMPIKMRLDGSDEILALTVERVRRDAIMLKRDYGGENCCYVLRIEDSGAIIYYGKESRDGLRVRRDQDAKPLEIASATKSQAYDRAVIVSQQLKRDAGVTLDVTVEAPRLDDNSTGWSAMADAVAIAGVALAEIVADSLGRETVAKKLDRVLIRDADQIAINVVDRTLVIEISASKPIVGRPSSGRLISTIGNLL
jgi:hypothetical protein